MAPLLAIDTFRRHGVYGHVERILWKLESLGECGKASSQIFPKADSLKLESSVEISRPEQLQQNLCQAPPHRSHY
jgi:hypothetical protein